ncbi:MAG: 5'/3'-nucleotidase SurE [Deltaproteobacteria bacterium]|nr:5'/3'-nucleotidase SurE [Deltaproteobacteria bacterium]
MKILISNDDGVYAWGLEVLHKHLKKLGRVWVVAPLEEKSTTGHSLTIHKPLRVHHLENGFYGVSGSPADCVYIGIREVIKAMPDVVISGINRGGNLGQDVYYSGTVSAAREACILGLPAIAVSCNIDPKKRKEEHEVHFETAARAIVKLLKEIALAEIPKHTLLNINVPDVPMNRIKGFRAVKQGFRFYSGTVLRRVDHRGRPYFWIGGQYKGYHNQAGTDCSAVADNYVSITPVQLDCTNHSYLQTLEGSL